MFSYILKRLLQIVPILWGVATVTFILMYIVPGDPARLLLGARANQENVEQIREQMGLDDPILLQYVRFLKNISKGDLGRSYVTNREVSKVILSRFPYTALLALTSLFIAVIVGVLLGVFSAIYRKTIWNQGAILISMIGISIPSFFLALILQLLFASKYHWFPVSGFEGPSYLMLPMVALATKPMAIFARLTRSSMLEVLKQDYIITAYAKGLGTVTVVFKHALRNALIPVLTAISGSLAALLSGAFFIEYIFNYPGIGLLGVMAINSYDFPMIQGTVLFSAVIFVMVNLLMDIVYTWLDPRIKFE